MVRAGDRGWCERRRVPWEPECVLTHVWACMRVCTWSVRVSICEYLWVWDPEWGGVVKGMLGQRGPGSEASGPGNAGEQSPHLLPHRGSEEDMVKTE